LDFPDGVAVAPDGGVYVADGLNSRIQKFTSEGVFVNKWGTQPAFYSEYNPDGGDGRFYYPKDVAVASDGSVYVSDTGNARIQKFTSEGVFVSKWGTRGTGDGELSNPNGVAVASDGSVYVVDDANSRIQKFTSEGAFLTKWGISSIGSYPAGDGQFEEPEGISVASDGSVYVADTRNYRIQKFTSEGVFVSKIEGSTWGTGDGQFQSPSGVAVSSDGSVYVADSGNNRIQKFSVGQ